MDNIEFQLCWYEFRRYGEGSEANRILAEDFGKINLLQEWRYPGGLLGALLSLLFQSYINNIMAVISFFLFLTSNYTFNLTDESPNIVSELS